jgi:NADH-quinone oxidoreductase subunit J
VVSFLPVLMLMVGSLGMPLPLAQAPVLQPVLIMVLCAVAGIGTYLLLPSRREGATRKIGGAIALLAMAVFGAVLFRYAAGQVQEGQPRVSPYFWAFAAITVIGGLRVVTHPRPVYSALYFVLTVFSTAGLFVLLAAEFMAAALVLIYAGAILVTYVFVIMLAQQSVAAGDKPMEGLAEYDTVAREPIAASVIGFVLMGILLFVIFDRSGPLTAAQDLSVQATVRGLGQTLFSRDLLSVEVAGVILTLAMVGAIAIARRRIPAETDAHRPIGDTTLGPATPADDNPHSIPVYGTENPRQKAYPEA